MVTRLNVGRGLAAVTFAIALTGLAPPADAQPGKQIQIHMKSNPQYRIANVTPTAKGVCRGSTNKKEDCEEQVAWILKGANLPDQWYVEVRLKVGAYKKCFASDSFKLAEDNTEVPSGPVNDKVCSRFDVWPYDVILFDGTDKDNPKEMGSEDPLVVINH